MLVEDSEFANNGYGDGYTHNLYIGNHAAFILRGSYSHHAIVGHLVKSRAYANTIVGNWLLDGIGGTASYEVDLPFGGTSIVSGNVIEQSASTQNPTLVAYGEEVNPAADHDMHFFFVGNTLLNDLGSGTFVTVVNSAPALLANNIFQGGGQITAQVGAEQRSNFAGDAKLVDAAQHDFHLLPGSPAIDAATDPGTLASSNLAPELEYVDPLSTRPRTAVGTASDIGAYEFGEPAPQTSGGGSAGASAGGSAVTSSGAGSASSAGASAEASQPGVTKAGRHGCASAGAEPLLLLGMMLVVSWRRRRD